MNTSGAVKDLYFIQRSQIARTVFTVTNEIIVDAKRGDRNMQCRFDLSSLAIEYDRVRHRSYRRCVIAIALASITGALTWKLFQLPLPSGALSIYIYTFGMFTVAFLWIAFRSSRRVELVRFKRTDGTVAFEIAKEREQAAECEEFVLALVTRIRASKQGRK